jgi:DNA-binding HxlR family transcriptional regulator
MADRKVSKETAQFAYEGLDRTIHERARLGILTSLIAHPKGIVFGNLKQMCGNLSRHLAVLEEGGIVEIVKSFPSNRPQTLCRITGRGRQRYLDYLQVLEKVVRDASDAMKSSERRSAAGGMSKA